MARALIVGCGCRGRALGAALIERGWQARGTTRQQARLGAIEAAGIEAALADPGRIGTVFEQVEGVAIIHWLMGGASGESGDARAANGERLRTLFEMLVDTPVRGLVFEGAGEAEPGALAEGAAVAREASERWRIPVEVTAVDSSSHEEWLEEMLAAGERALLVR